jgi:hypothetical protein
MENQATFKMVLCGDGGTVSRCILVRQGGAKADYVGYVLMVYCFVLSLPPSSLFSGKVSTAIVLTCVPS